MAENIDVLVCAKQVVTIQGDEFSRKGSAMMEVQEISNGAVAIREDKILAVGQGSDLKSRYSPTKRYEFPHHCLTPGLVDPHTHLVYAGSRERDFYERIAGVSYEAIAQRGGGIRDSVRQLRKASKEDLRNSAKKRLRQMLSHGTTTCEIKSGYGLSFNDEIKTLEVIQDLQKSTPMSIVPTFLGAHEIPDEFRDNREAYIKLLCEEILPEVAQRKLARYCDIFCEKGVFSIEESRKILTRARELGFELKLHVDELAEGFGGATLAAEMTALSAEHLVRTDRAGILAMKKAGTLAVLLPATIFFINKEHYAPARSFIEEGVAVALATDLNPGSSNTESLQVVMTLAALKLKMKPEEILVAVTHNAACAIGENHRLGRIMAGLQADLVVWDLADFRQIPYHFGGNRVHKVMKNGKFVWEALE